jgi:hypothetical protein
MKKRFELRRQVTRQIEVITTDWDEPVQLTTQDLSPRGAYIKSNYLPQMGEYVVCSFSLGKKQQYDFFGKVVRTNLKRRKTDVRAAGFGVEFVDSRPLERIAIRNALKGTPPPAPVMRKITGKSKNQKSKVKI